MRESTESAFRLWLKEARRNSDPVIRDKISRCRRVERAYEVDLDELFDKGRVEPLLEELCCAPSEKPRHRIPLDHVVNPSKSTADLKNAVAAYLAFRHHRKSPSWDG